MMHNIQRFRHKVMLIGTSSKMGRCYRSLQIVCWSGGFVCGADKRRLSLHFVQYGQNHVEGGPFTRIFVHADGYQFREVGWGARWHFQSETFGGDAHTAFHWRQIAERDLPRAQFPNAYGEAPHIARLPIPIGAFLLQRFGWHPGGLIQAAALLEWEFRISHIYTSG